MSLLKRKGLGSLQEATSLAAHEWTLPDLARELGLPIETVRGWAKLGWVGIRQTPTQRFYMSQLLQANYLGVCPDCRGRHES